MKREAVMNRRLGLLKDGHDPQDVLQQLRRERERGNQLVPAVEGVRQISGYRKRILKQLSSESRRKKLPVVIT